MIGAAVCVISITAAYLLGAIPTSFLMAKYLKGVDIRREGSGNAGATNVLRIVGKLPALATLIIDIAKGVIAVTLLADCSYPFTGGSDYELYRILLGASAIGGHIWPIFLGFRGGKGVATTIGVVATLAPAIFFPAIAVWLAIFIFTNYVSVASLGFGISLPIFSIILNRSIYMTIFAITLCMINTYKHRGNVKRLIRGEEPKTRLIKNQGS